MNYKRDIESLLFVAGEPVEIRKIAKILNIENEKVLNILNELKEDYKNAQSALMILIQDDTAEMVVCPESDKIVEMFFKSERQENLTDAAAETLSIIAYRGPLTKTQIEEIRGVNCTFILRNLLIRGLIEREPNPEGESGSFIYKVSLNFLKHLGIEKVEDLPDYDKFKSADLSLNV